MAEKYFGVPLDPPTARYVSSLLLVTPLVIRPDAESAPQPLHNQRRIRRAAVSRARLSHFGRRFARKIVLPMLDASGLYASEAARQAVV